MNFLLDITNSPSGKCVRLRTGITHYMDYPKGSLAFNRMGNKIKIMSAITGGTLATYHVTTIKQYHDLNANSDALMNYFDTNFSVTQTSN